ncbi:MAG: 30S ribosomal protein S9 [Candidatus Xenobia bacterium]
MAKVKTQAPSVVYAATGRRKRAIARVRVIPGKGDIKINDRPVDQYVGRKTLEQIVREPLVVADALTKFDVLARCYGGGVAGQAGAVRHAIARALLIVDETLRQPLRRAGLLTRDPREKESKKYGRKRARRGFQWTKR